MLSAEDPLLELPSAEAQLAATGQQPRSMQEYGVLLKEYEAAGRVRIDAFDLAGRPQRPPDAHVLDALCRSEDLVSLDAAVARRSAETVAFVPSFYRCGSCAGVARYDVTLRGGGSAPLCAFCLKRFGYRELGSEAAAYLMTIAELPDLVRRVYEELCRRLGRMPISDDHDDLAPWQRVLRSLGHAGPDDRGVMSHVVGEDLVLAGRATAGGLELIRREPNFGTSDRLLLPDYLSPIELRAWLEVEFGGPAVDPPYALTEDIALQHLLATRPWANYERYVDLHQFLRDGLMYVFPAHARTVDSLSAEIVARRSTDPTVLGELATAHPDEDVRRRAAERAECPPQAHRHIAEHEWDASVRGAVRDVTDDQDVVSVMCRRALLEVWPPYERLHLALHRACPPELATVLQRSFLEGGVDARVALAEAAADALDRIREPAQLLALAACTRRSKALKSVVRAACAYDGDGQYSLERERWLLAAVPASARSRVVWALEELAEERGSPAVFEAELIVGLQSGGWMGETSEAADTQLALLLLDSNGFSRRLDDLYVETHTHAEDGSVSLQSYWWDAFSAHRVALVTLALLPSSVAAILLIASTPAQSLVEVGPLTLTMHPPRALPIELHAEGSRDGRAEVLARLDRSPDGTWLVTAASRAFSDLASLVSAYSEAGVQGDAHDLR